MFAPKITKICQSFFKSQSLTLGMLFDVFLFISTYILMFCFPQVVQKQTMGELEYWTLTWRPVVPRI